MPKISWESIEWTYYPEGSQACLPCSIHLSDEMSLERGMIVKWEGNEGIVYELVFVDRDNKEFQVHIFWYSGPLSQDSDRQKSRFSWEEFLPLIGCELEVDQEN